nr:EOG090X00E0 [Cyclestheria hislopi]
MGKLRTRIKSSKGKRWAKGQSSSSNPVTNKHREAAKNNFFRPFPLNTASAKGPNTLTEETLKRHTFASLSDPFSLPKSGPPSESITSPPSVINGQFDDDVISHYSGTTFGTLKSYKTFATNFTNCSSLSFSKLYRTFTPTSALHREMVAVLAAVAEVIKQQGGKESEVEYFAALMTTLEVNEMTEESLGAAVCLLGMVIKRVPANILKLEFSKVAKSLLDLLSRHIESENNVLVRSLIGCLGVLLRTQDANVWSASSTLQIYDSLLTFSVHPKAKIRKAAQHAICSILKGSTLLVDGPDPPLLHPVAGHTAKYCLKFIEEHGFGSESSSLLHMLNMLKEIFGVFPQSEVKSLSESLLKLMTMKNVLVTSCSMQSFYGLLNSRPKSVTLSADLNARLIAALYDYQPSLNDAQSLGAWLTVMTQAHVNLGRLDSVLCAGHLPHFFTTATELWLSDRLEVVQAVTPSLALVLTSCLEPAMTSQSPPVSSAEKIIGSIEQGLGFQYIQAWKYVIHLCTTAIEVVGRSQPKCLTNLLKSLAFLRVSPQFPYESEAEYAIGKAIRILGPRFVLKCIPLNMTGEEDAYDFPQSWLLPILRENVSHTELGFFIEYFLPLALAFNKRSISCRNKQDLVGFKVIDLLEKQIWALLPSFCKYPTDVEKSFKVIAKDLGKAISDRPDIRMDIMAALRQLIIHSKEEQGRNEISRYAKNYLPILFNVFITKPSSDEMECHRRSAYDTILYYLQIADTNLLNSLFDKAKSKLESVLQDEKSPTSSEDTKFTWDAVLDLLRALVVYQDEGRIESIVNMCAPWIFGKDFKQQKKAYRVVEQIVTSEKDTCKKLMESKFNDVIKLFEDSRSSVKPTSKASRLRSVSHIVSLLQPVEEHRSFLTSSMREAVMGVKEIGEKARSASYLLLTNIGKVLQSWFPSPQEALSDYVKLLLVDVNGTPIQASTTIASLTHVLHEFASVCTEELVHSILSVICELLNSPSREVVAAALGFIRMFVVTVHSQRLPFYLKVLVDSLSSMPEEFQSAYRLKTRDIFVRLMRKCGTDFVIKLVPEENTTLLKRLNNLRKIEARKKRLKEAGKQQEDADDEEEETQLASQPKTMEHVLADSDDDLEEEEENKKKGTHRTAKAWIHEGDAILDFLDPKSVQKVSATNPKTAPNAAVSIKKKKESLFKTAPDGRLIIKEPKDAAVSDDEQSDEPIIQALGDLAVNRKRKLEGEDSSDEENTFKYQAGGSGIHRPIEPSEKSFGKSSPKSNGKKMKKTEKPVDYGAEYRSNKAKGDVKRKGQPDPFAYVPLSRSVLNKRKAAKMKGQFKSLVHGARKGASAGTKAHKKN